MDNKYYIPSIEEFRVGFEFEFLSSSMKLQLIDFSKPDEKLDFDYNTEGWIQSWTKRKIEDLYDFNLVLDLFNEGKNNHNLRVKYLCKEDIESLGWVHTGGKLQSQSAQLYEYKYFIIMYTELNQNCIISEKSYIRDNSGKYDEVVLFKGKLKNKSELEVILKQIGTI